jgi:hypothetical protein
MTKSQIAAALSALFITFTPAQAQQADPDTSITVFKTPWCGCCQLWVDRMIEAGYTVRTRDMEDLSFVRQQGGISEDLQACHTAVIGGARRYVLEGHVPIEAVERLMSERPDIRGIAVPGMPTGSLGMGFDPGARYTVYAFTGATDAEPTVFLEMGQ